MSTTIDGTVNFPTGLHMLNSKVDGPVTITPDGVLLNSTPNDANGIEGHALWVSNGPYTITNSGTIFTSSVFGEEAAGIFVDSTADGSKITNKAEGSISGYATGVSMDGNTVLTNSGLISGHAAVTGSTFAGDGSYSVINSGIIAGINALAWPNPAKAIFLAGSGKQTVSNSATGEMFGNIYMSGVVTFKNDGFVEGDIELSGHTATTATFANKGFILGDVAPFAVTMNFGLKHVASNAATGTIAGGIQFGNGDALYVGSFKNDGLVDGDVDFDCATGTMTFANKGTVDGDVTSDTNIVKMTNSGSITGSITLSDGNDIVKNTGSIGGVTILLGAGNDQFFGGTKQGDTVTDEAGTDIYKFGSKNDTFIAVGAGSELNTDTVDGGANLKAVPGIDMFGDVYDASAAGATTNLRINMDTVNVTSLVLGVTFGTVMTAGTATDSVGGSKFGTDLIKNFETAYGGSGSDIIIGNASANLIEGNGNADELWGGKGNDSLNGGSGGDFLVGGLGRDQLTGGDASTDFFVYTSSADSTLALSGRDLIQDFTTGEDEINLVALGMTGFSLIGAAFSFDPGGGAEGKVMQTNIGWTLLIDSDDDGKADFAIDFFDPTHTNQLISGDIDWN